MSRVAEALAPEWYGASHHEFATPWMAPEPEQRKAEAIQETKKVLQQHKQTVKTSRNPMTMTGYSKFLEEVYGIKAGRNRLIRFFEEMNVLDIDRHPRRDVLENGLFSFYIRKLDNGNIAYVPQITPAGQKYFFEDVRREFAA